MRRRSLLLVGVLKFLNKPLTIRWYLFDAYITTKRTPQMPPKKANPSGLSEKNIYSVESLRFCR